MVTKKVPVCACNEERATCTTCQKGYVEVVLQGIPPQFKEVEVVEQPPQQLPAAAEAGQVTPDVKQAAAPAQSEQSQQAAANTVEANLPPANPPSPAPTLGSAEVVDKPKPTDPASAPSTAAPKADLDDKAALSYFRTHGVKILSSAPSVSDLDAPFVAVCDAADTDLWRGISLLNCNAMTLSWPCQSFSGAGSQSGWKSIVGQTFQDVLAKASQMRAENVAPVWERKDFRQGMMTRIDQAGYILIFARVLPLQHVTPVSRRRFLAVMTHSSFHDVHPIDLAKSVAAAYFGKPRSLEQDDAWFASLPGDLLQNTYLSPDLLLVYSNPDFAPGRPCTPQVAISNRKIKPSEPLPATVVMCMYSRQHTIKSSTLSEKKLLGALREENGRFRFLSALEILVSLGTTQPITLVKNLQDGCSIVGNSIAEVHAYAPLWIALQAKDLLKIGCLKSFEHLIQCFQISRLRAIPQIVQVTQDLIRFGIACQEIPFVPTTHQVRISIQLGGRFYIFNAEVGTDFATAVDAQADLNSAMFDFWRNGCTFDTSTTVKFPLCLIATDKVFEPTNLEVFDVITPTLIPPRCW